MKKEEALFQLMLMLGDLIYIYNNDIRAGDTYISKGWCEPGEYVPYKGLTDKIEAILQSMEAITGKKRGEIFEAHIEMRQMLKSRYECENAK